MPQSGGALLIIGAGNRDRGDDAAGLIAARLTRERLAGAGGVMVLEHEGDGASMVELFQDAGAVIVIDAVRSGAPPGRVHRFDATLRPLPATLQRASTHGFGVADALELARALGRLPARVIVYGIEAASFDHGAPLSPPVRSAVASVAARIARHVRRTWVTAG